jgi:hypothetical protein
LVLKARLCVQQLEHRLGARQEHNGTDGTDDGNVTALQPQTHGLIGVRQYSTSLNHRAGSDEMTVTMEVR